MCWVWVEVKGWKLKEPLERVWYLVWESDMGSFCTVTWMPDCLGFIVMSGSSPQGRVLEKKVRTLVCIYFPFNSWRQVCTNLGALEKFLFRADNDILILGCKDRTDPIGYGFQMCFFSITSLNFLTCLFVFRKHCFITTPHLCKYMNYSKLWFMTMSVSY